MAQSTEENSTIDPYKFLNLTRNSDGSITRQMIPFTLATPNPEPSSLVFTKDVPINKSKNTWVRVFVPSTALNNSSSTTKLPLIVYNHGGGFILGSAGSTLFHDYVTVIAVETQSVVISVEYRLAPEHHLPAAYDDCVEALHWIKTCRDEWLDQYVDFSNCCLMGGSAGGNIAYHVALRVSRTVDDLKPLKIQGLILHQPFFSGLKRTSSELRLEHNERFPLIVSDLMWELSLPIGVDRDHEYCNPTMGKDSKSLEEIQRLRWRVLVTGCDGDPLIDRQIDLAKMLEEKGIEVVGKFREGGYHGCELFDDSKGKELCATVVHFMSSSLGIGNHSKA